MLNFKNIDNNAFFTQITINLINITYLFILFIFLKLFIIKSTPFKQKLPLPLKFKIYDPYFGNTNLSKHLGSYIKTKTKTFSSWFEIFIK